MQTTSAASGLRVLVGEPSRSLPARADRRAPAWVQGQAPPEGPALPLRECEVLEEDVRRADAWRGSALGQGDTAAVAADASRGITPRVVAAAPAPSGTSVP